MNRYIEPDLYNVDCMVALGEFPDKFFDLAIVDPPYGRGDAERQDYTRSECVKNSGITRTGGTWASKYTKKIDAWDMAPGQEYFNELFRVSRDQIIWGGNYFRLPPTRCFIVWRKATISENFSMAMAEYAWTSFSGNAKVYECKPQGDKNDKRFHPCQKPIQLYLWLLDNYAKKGNKILDTHCGSASSLIACHRAGIEGWGFEIDKEYYKQAKLRLDRERDQVSIFEII